MYKSRYPSQMACIQFCSSPISMLFYSITALQCPALKVCSNMCCSNTCLECQVTVLSKLDFNKCVCKSINFRKKSVHHLNSNLRPPERKSAALPIELYGCGFRWNVARVFSTSLSSTCCSTQSDHCFNSQ